MRFVQSEIPEELLPLKLQGREPIGVAIKDKLIKQFYGTEDLEKEGKYILNFASDIEPSIKAPYPAWFLFGKLVDLFYPYPDGFVERNTLFSK